MAHPRLYSFSFASIYQLYLVKVERKGRTKAELDTVICWLTGYSQKEFEQQIEKETNLEDFLMKAAQLNPKRSLITGVVCGVRVEDIQDPIMREIRYMDKLVDELAKGKKMEKILRQ